MDLIAEIANSDLSPLSEVFERLSKSSTSLWSGAQGKTAKQPQHRLTETEVDALVELYVSGATIRAVMERFDVDRTTVQRKLDERGVRRPHHPALDAAGEQRVVELYRSGLPIKAVAKELGVGEGTVRQALIKHGVDRRPSSFRS